MLLVTPSGPHGTGHLTFAEFSSGFERFYTDPHQFKDDENPEIREASTFKHNMPLAFERIDYNCEGSLSWHNFLIAASPKAELVSPQNLRDCFESIDIYKKGFITYDDLERYFGRFQHASQGGGRQLPASLLKSEVSAANTLEYGGGTSTGGVGEDGIDESMEHKVMRMKPVWDDIMREPLLDLHQGSAGSKSIDT